MKYYPRLKTQGPPQLLDTYGLEPYAKSLSILHEALNDEKISYGQYDLMRGLLTQGSIQKYPAGVGIDYAHLIKNTLDSKATKNALIEMSNEVPENTDVIFGIQNSGVVLANVIGFHTKKRVETIFKTTRQKYRGDESLGVLIDSYTKGEQNVLYIDPILSVRLKNLDKKTIRVILVDDICDTGTLFQAINGLVKSASKKLHLNIKIIRLMALFERTHTGSYKMLRKKLGIGMTSIIKAEDMGQKPNSWLKIKGVRKALSFKKT